MLDSTRVDVKDVETPGASVHKMPIIGEGAGVSLPGGIIILGRIKEDGNTREDKATLQHEYGHQLQIKERGVARYITEVALPSIKSASDPDVSAEQHLSKPFEMDASTKAAKHYGPNSEIARDDKYQKYQSYFIEYVETLRREANNE